jgi:uncharacterized protein YcbX
MGDHRTIALSELFVYPIKSCRGIRLPEARLAECGIEHDREWMVVDRDGLFLTQREHPRMALIETLLTPDALRLSAPGLEALEIPLLGEEGPRHRVRVWSYEGTAVDQGDAAAEWLSSFLGMGCRLVRHDRAFQRPVDPAYAVGDDRVGFADAFPLLLISQASLDDLNARLPEPIAMERFRPNLVISGCAPYEEDRWRTLEIHGVTFHVAKPCARCTVPTVDPRTGERGVEPLRTLATYRRDSAGKVYFGQNLIHEPKHGVLRVGDPVQIIRTSLEGSA